MGTDPTPANARNDNFKLKKALLAENNKEIRLELDQREKVKNIAMPNTKIERLPDTVRRQIMVQIPLPSIGQQKEKKSSQWENRRDCRHSTTGLRETHSSENTGTHWT